MPVFYVKYQKISSLYNKIYLIKDTEIKLRLKKYGCYSRILKLTMQGTVCVIIK